MWVPKAPTEHEDFGIFNVSPITIATLGLPHRTKRLYWMVWQLSAKAALPVRGTWHCCYGLRSLGPCSTSFWGLVFTCRTQMVGWQFHSVLQDLIHGPVPYEVSI